VTVAAPTVDDLLGEATRSTGLDDFGPGDFRDGLGVLLDSLAADAELDEVGTVQVLGDLRRRLTNRLEVEAWWATHPEAEHAVVQGPVDITGLPRTGTTALAAMLSVDPRFRCLRRWEQAQPIPPPRLDGEADDPRRLAGAREVAAYRSAIDEKHLFELDATSEDLEVLGMAFHAPHFTLPASGYHAWWRAADLTDAYRYHRRVLQVLQSTRPPDRWLLKAPHHTFHLEAFVATFPDARFVMTHRDPVKAVPSWASIVISLRPGEQGEGERHRLGRAAAEHLRASVTSAMASRARLGDDRFLDIHHRDLVRDPMGTVRRIYRWLEIDLTPDVETAIARWQAANRTGSRGTHRYAPADFGLRAAELRADFDDYVRHFAIEIEVEA
jgi:hypothetical protein